VRPQGLREFGSELRDLSGTTSARQPRMGISRDEAWTIPLHVIMWTTFLVGLIMLMAVLMMH
jgi:hypothetical protein